MARIPPGRKIKIAVCIKQVPVVSLLRFDDETKRLVREGVPSEVNPFDVMAMSAVASLKEVLPVEVVVFTMGPPQARDALVQCLAMGADRAVHLVDRAFAGSDTLATARALSLGIRRESFDLVVCGRNSVDAETGQVGPEIAEMLDLPQITAVRRLEVSDSGKGITVERVTDGGYDEVYCALPALITVTEGIAREVYPGREDIEAARSKPIIELAAADLSTDASLFGQEGSPTLVSDFYPVDQHREGVVAKDRPIEEAVTLLLDYLERRGVFGEQPSWSMPDETPRGPSREQGRAGAIWVVAELLRGEVRTVTLELLGRARELAPQVETNVEAVLMGDGVHRHAATLTAYGADRVYLADDTRLARYETEVRTSVLTEAIKAQAPCAVLVPSTIDGLDLAARVAARLGLGLTGDCVGLEVDAEGRLVQLKPAFGGNIVAPILSRTMPQMATVRPGILTPVAPDWTVEPVVRTLGLGLPPDPRVSLLESIVDSSVEGAELEKARVIVTVGKGVGAPENIAIVRELAETLGGALGATRDVADLGWLPRQHQIGLSGKAVSPDLYIAVGVRGPFNHTVGIQRAGTVVAINNQARAPIFRAADFGIVGDYAEVVPALIRAIERRRAAQRG